MLKEERAENRMLIPTFVLLILFVYVPVVLGAFMAFENYNMLDLTNVHFIGLENFKAIIFDPYTPFWLCVKNTLWWVLGSLVFQFVLGFTLALLLKKPFKGRGIYTGLVFCGWALSGFAIGLTWSWMYNGQFGMINDLFMKLHIIKEPVGWLSDPKIAMWSVIATNVWLGVPFFGIMLLAALQSVPDDLYDAAEIDGANKAMQLFHVTIPYIRPTIFATVLLRFMWISNNPDIIYAMTNGGPVNSTQILATDMVNKVFKEYDLGQGAALGLIMIVFLMIFATIYLKLTSKTEE